MNDKPSPKPRKAKNTTSIDIEVASLILAANYAFILLSAASEDESGGGLKWIKEIIPASKLMPAGNKVERRNTFKEHLKNLKHIYVNTLKPLLNPMFTQMLFASQLQKDLKNPTAEFIVKFCYCISRHISENINDERTSAQAFNNEIFPFLFGVIEQTPIGRRKLIKLNDKKNSDEAIKAVKEWQKNTRTKATNFYGEFKKNNEKKEKQVSAMVENFLLQLGAFSDE